MSIKTIPTTVTFSTEDYKTLMNEFKEINAKMVNMKRECDILNHNMLLAKPKNSSDYRIVDSIRMEKFYAVYHCSTYNKLTYYDKQQYEKAIEGRWNKRDFNTIDDEFLKNK